MPFSSRILEDGRTATLGSTGGAKEYDLPTDMTTCVIAITQQGDNTTDASTLAERLAGIGTIEVITARGGEIYIDADDLFYLTGYFDRDDVGVDLGGAAADKEMATTVYVPLSLGVSKWFDRAGNLYGLAGKLANKLRVTWGTDANAGMDSRQATVQVFGWVGKDPLAYTVFRLDSYTSVADQFRTQKVSGAGKLRGLFGFSTTNLNVDTAETTLGVKEAHIWVNEKPILEALTIGLQKGAQGILADDPAGQTGILSDEYWFWNFDPQNEGSGLPIVTNMKTACKGGVAEAVRVYPLIYRRV